MNLIVIGKDTDNVAMDIWKGNTNFCVLNECPSIFNKMFVDYIQLRKVIVSTSEKQFRDVPPNKFVDFMNKEHFIPVFIVDEDEPKDSLSYAMYYNVYELIPSTLLYKRNKENKDYEEFVKIAQGYLNNKGIIENGDKTIRTPRKRKASTSKK